MSIGELLDNSVTHERIPVAVDRRLTAGAWAGLGLLLVQLGVLHVGRNATGGFATWGLVRWAFTGFGHPDVAFTGTKVVVAAGLIGAVATWGFTRAATLGHHGQLALLAGGVAAAVPAVWIVVVGLATLALLAVFVVVAARLTVVLAPIVFGAIVVVLGVLVRLLLR